MTYPCPLAENKLCRYGGNKNYNYGFVSGSASFCRLDKKWVHDLEKCPLENTQNVQAQIDELGRQLAANHAKLTGLDKQDAE